MEKGTRMHDAYRHSLRHSAQELMAGRHTEHLGPEVGHALLALLEKCEELEAHMQAVAARYQELWERVAAWDERWQAELEEIRDFNERQREMIEYLFVENEDLRAKLYVQERQKPGDAGD